jgi:leader peptidase (prepilin peptidase) / N-methyltransferase
VIDSIPAWLLWTYATLVGACVGSFLNVCVYRLPEGLSVVRPRSRCPACETPIAWYDNLPVVSYLVLRGRCRACGASFSPQYAIVEVATALIWLAAVVRFGASWQALSVAIFFTLLLGIALTDLRTYIIPHEFTIGGLIFGLLVSVAPGGVTPLQSALGALLGFGFLYLAAVVGEWALKKPAMGGGDIWMMAMVGAFLGPMGAVLTIFLGSLAGIIVFVPISLRTKKLVPFGIFLALGAAITEGWGDMILSWYQTNFLGG